MRSSRRNRTAAVIGTLGTLGLVITILPVSALPSAAADGCPATTTVTDSQVKSARLVIGTTTVRSVDLIAEVKDHCRISRVDVTLTSPDSSGTFRAHWLETRGDYSYWRVVVDLKADDLLNADAGTWTTKITAKGSTTSTKAGPTVKVLRNALVTVDATPEPVRRGKIITLTGRVERADWETKKYAGYPDRPVELQWRPLDGSYRTLKTIKSTKGGVLKTTVHAGRDGCYRFVFGGSPVAGDAAAKGDCVDVR